jgi:plastocyanin
MNVKPVKAVTAFLLIAGSVVFFGCGSSGSRGTTGPVIAAQRLHFQTVTIQNLAYNPSAVTVAVGDTVQWINADDITHTVTADNGTEFDQTLTPGDSFQHVFLSAGDFPYHCTIHPFMHGSVTVL